MMSSLGHPYYESCRQSGGILEGIDKSYKQFSSPSLREKIERIRCVSLRKQNSKAGGKEKFL